MDETQLQKLTGLFDEMKSNYGKLGGEIATNGKGLGETIEKLAKLQDEYGKLREAQEKQRAEQEKQRTDGDSFAADVREQLGALGNGKAQERKTLGELVTEHEGFKTALAAGGRFSWAAKFQGSIDQFRRKDISGISLLLPDARTDIAAGLGIPPYGVRQLVPQGRTTAGAVSYVRETSFTNNAAPVAEGAAKPKSDKVFTVVNEPVQTIAHYFKITKQCFDDLPALASLVQSQGVEMLKFKEDDQLLNGTGTPPQLRGFMSVATAAGATPAGVSLVDAIGASVFSLAAKGYAPDGAVVNPADWGAMAMLKNSQGNYLFVNPLAYTINGSLWGTRVVASANMTAKAYLVGAFRGNSLILDREEVNVQVATQNEDDFIHNLLTVLIEERLALLIFQAAAFEKGTMTPPTI